MLHRMMTEFAPRTALWRARVEDAFAAAAMMRSIGARLDLVEPGRVTISAPIDPAFTQQHGAGHAGLTFTLGDTAAGFAAQSLMGETDGVMSIEVKINLLAPARGDRLRAEGLVLRSGRSISVVRAEVWAETAGAAPVHAATLLGTMMKMENMG